MSERIEIVTGDITQFEVDAIVNSAHSNLTGGGGTDGAIRGAAGPELLEACKELGECPYGEARITSGCQLPSQFVIHLACPVYTGKPAVRESLYCPAGKRQS